MTEWISQLRMMEMKLVQLLLLLIAMMILAVLIKWTVRVGILQKVPIPWLNRTFPVIEIVLWVSVMTLGIHTIFNKQPIAILILSTVLFSILLWAARFAIKDFVCGVILKAEEAYKLHDHIRFDDIDGLISKAGIRSLQITAANGQKIRVPYSRISSTLFAKTTQKSGSYVHTFRLEIPKSASISTTIENAKLTIANCIWSSVVNEPSIRYFSEDRTHNLLEITVYTINSDYFSKIEDKVRQSLGIEDRMHSHPQGKLISSGQ